VCSFQLFVSSSSSLHLHLFEACRYKRGIGQLTSSIPHAALSVGSRVLVLPKGAPASDLALRYRPATLADVEAEEGVCDAIFDDNTRALPEDEDAIPFPRITPLPVNGAGSTSPEGLRLLRSLHLNILRCVLSLYPLQKDAGLLTSALRQADAAIAISLVLPAPSVGGGGGGGARGSSAGTGTGAGGGAAGSGSGSGAGAGSSAAGAGEEDAAKRVHRDADQGTAWYLRARVFQLQHHWQAARVCAGRAGALLPAGKAGQVESLLRSIERGKEVAKRKGKKLAREVTRWVQTAMEGMGPASGDGGGGAAAGGYLPSM
jgi:hypothetical protein